MALPAEVLVVEDEVMVRLLLQELLEEAGLRVAVAADGARAFAALDGSASHALVLVTDLNLGPGPDGLSVAAEARRRLPGLCVFYATGNPDLLDEQGRLGCCDRIYAKPFDAMALTAEVLATVRAARRG